MSRYGLFRFASLFVISAAVVAWRRQDQLFVPTLWYEEGTQLLQRFADCGWWCALWRPVNGSIVLVSKAILLPTFEVSVLNAATISAVGAAIFSSIVVACVGVAPTHLKLKYLCALSTLMVPMAPEAYGVALYAFWWSGILVLLALLWVNERGMLAARVGMLVIGGLSTPLMMPIAPLFLWRAWRERKNDEIIIATLAAALAIIATIVWFSGAHPTNPPVMPTLNRFVEAIAHFFGWFIAPGTAHPFRFGGPFLAILLCLVFVARKQLDGHSFLLAGAIVAAAAASMARSAIEEVDPFDHGARYFFYVYIFLSFAMFWLAWALAPRVAALLPIAAVCSAIIGGVLMPGFRWQPVERLAWRDKMLECARSPSDGWIDVHLSLNWQMSLTAAQCRGLIARSWLDRLALYGPEQIGQRYATSTQ